jgi:hypothetical protein
VAKAPKGIDQTELTVVARRVLLDGLTALGPHLDAIIVVGGQAVALRTPNAAVASAAYTSDGDLSLDPQLLGTDPLVDEALRSAGFTLMKTGLWVREYLRDLFGRPRGLGVDMAVRALAGDVPEVRVRALAPAFVREL